MKKSSTILAVLVAILAVFLVTSCEELADAMSAQDCMEDFVSDVNDGNYGDLKQYTHPDSQLHSEADANFWETRIGDYAPLELGTVTDIGAEATGVGGEAIIFKLEEDADDDDSIKITDIAVNGTPIFFNVK